MAPALGLCRGDRDLPPMTMRRIAVGGHNLILINDRGGPVRAFHNTCRHRGAELCPVDERALQSRLIVCPYHQWSYGLSGDLAEREAGQTFVTLLPTMFVVAHVDYVRIVSLHPVGPERTALKAEWLFPAATLAAPGFDLGNVVNFAGLVMMQDGAACEMNQRGLHSERFERGTLMPQEFDVLRFQEWVRRALNRPA